MNQFLIQENILSKIPKIKKLVERSIDEYNRVDISVKSTKGPGSKQYSIPFKRENEELFKIIKKETLRYLKKYNFKPKDIFPVSCWTVLGQEYGYHKFHRHTITDDIATITYLDVPKDKEKGNFYCIVNNESFEIEPAIGTIIIMSGNIFHGSFPQGKGLRTTFNLDFRQIYDDHIG